LEVANAIALIAITLSCFLHGHGGYATFP
jgi:hypothetical protein